MSSRAALPSRAAAVVVLALAGTLLPGAARPVASAGSAPPAAPGSGGKVYLTQEEALALAFPECEVARGTAFLSEKERERVAALAKVESDLRTVFPYVARKEGALVGTAYFDTHRVRTLRESVMVVVAPDETIARIELLAFGEPEDYVPSGAWYAQFLGRPLDEELSLKRKIRGVTGATLTARATLGAARRVLAVHRVLAERREREEEAKRKKEKEEEREREKEGDGERKREKKGSGERKGDEEGDRERRREQGTKGDDRRSRDDEDGPGTTAVEKGPAPARSPAAEARG